MEAYPYDEDMEEVVLDDEMGELTGGWFLRIIREGEIIINLCYMIIGGLFTLVIKYH